MEALTYGTGIRIKEDGSWEANPNYADQHRADQR